MPAIWSSSERPITIRSVWVNGIRHAILSQDDPLMNVISRKRPQTSTPKEKKYPMKYIHYKSSSENLSNCFLKLRIFVNEAAESATQVIQRPSSHSKRNRKEGDDLLCRMVDLMKTYSDDYASEDSDSDETKEEEEKKIIQVKENSLTERVLQWLDLCGKDFSYNMGARCENKGMANNKCGHLGRSEFYERNNSSEEQNEELESTKKEWLKAVEVKKVTKKEELLKLRKLQRNEAQRWTTAKKTQLHIFIPNLNTTSSLESLNYAQ